MLSRVYNMTAILAKGENQDLKAVRRVPTTDDGYRFNLVGGAGALRYVLRQDNATGVRFDFETSMKLLAQAGLQPLYPYEDLPILVKATVLRNALTFDSPFTWFWVNPIRRWKDIAESDGLYTLDKNTRIHSHFKLGDGCSPEEIIRIRIGDQMPSLTINSNTLSEELGHRFLLSTNVWNNEAAPIVVGKNWRHWRSAT